MSANEKPQPGQIVWTDLTVPNAEAVREFYSQVVGWQSSPVAMEGYEDFSMIPAGSDRAAVGICHARGANAALPPEWLIYIAVSDLDQSMERCMTLGGRVIAGPRDMGGGMRFCVIQDPAGAVAALMQFG